MQKSEANMAATVLYMPTTLTFVDRYGIQMTMEPVDRSPVYYGFLPENARHFKCRLVRDDKEMTVVFTMTPEHGETPDVMLVLGALANEATIFETHGEAIRQGDERVFGALADHAQRLKEFLGPDAYDELLWTIRR